MQSPATDRRVLLRLAASILDQVESGSFGAALVESGGLESPDAASVPTAVIGNAVAGALEWARLEGESIASQASLESLTPTSANIPYLPSNQVLALLQSAYDEYAEERLAKKSGELEIPFDTADPGWISVAFEKLKALLRGKRRFISHTNLTSFHHNLPPDATVALFADWGTGEPTAQRVMEQIRLAKPTHCIHLGDVYYSGTPREIEKRFLSVIDQFGPPPATCRYFALNSNHEMYSGGYGYFDTTLPRFQQEASYFNLRNENWQLVGVDSGYEDFGLNDPQKEWLAAQLQAQGPRSILLSHHQLFSPYETRAFDRTLSRKVADLLSKIYAWFWGHEHRCIVFGDHLGIKARCIGHGAIPSSVPYGDPKFPDIPILRVDERPSTDGTNIHGFALLRFAGKRLDVSYVDEFGAEFFAERLDKATALSILVPRGVTESLDARPSLAAITAHYKGLLKRGESVGRAESLSGLEDTGGEPDLSQNAIKDRVENAEAELHRIVKDHLGDKPDLHELVDQLIKEGRASLDALSQEAIDDSGDVDHMASALEVIVRTDGSRPSFMVRNGAVDTTTSPVGAWAQRLEASAAAGLLTDALACVGRIDVPGSSQGFEGTGFLVEENLIITNRHVLQAIARPDSTGIWTFKPGVAIDFGHEFRARDSISPRALKSVIFCPARVINSPIDHSKLDLVLIELQRVQESERPRSVLAFDIAPDWASPTLPIYTVGYPGNPGLGEPLSLLEHLFQSTFGCKRLAPGEIQPPQSTVYAWTLAHDATTLGGNSGSVVLTAGREGAAAGLHYGGTRAAPRENWGHLLGRVLAEPDRVSGKTLRECLDSFGVNLVDRRRL